MGHVPPRPLCFGCRAGEPVETMADNGQRMHVTGRTPSGLGVTLAPCTADDGDPFAELESPGLDRFAEPHPLEAQRRRPEKPAYPPPPSPFDDVEFPDVDHDRPPPFLSPAACALLVVGAVALLAWVAVELARASAV